MAFLSISFADLFPSLDFADTSTTFSTILSAISFTSSVVALNFSEPTDTWFIASFTISILFETSSVDADSSSLLVLKLDALSTIY